MKAIFIYAMKALKNGNDGKRDIATSVTETVKFTEAYAIKVGTNQYKSK